MSIIKYTWDIKEEEKSPIIKYSWDKPTTTVTQIGLGVEEKRFAEKPVAEGGTTLTKLPSKHRIQSLSLKEEYTPKPKPEPTWGEVIKHSLKSGLGQFQASLVNLIRLIDMGVTKITDPIQNIIPIDPEKAKAFKEKYGIDPDINTTDMLTKIVKESEKIASESQDQAESKQWLKKLVGTGLQATPQIVGSAILGVGMPVVGGLAAAKPTAEIITRVTQMIPFGLSAMGGQARQIEKEYEELGKEAPYYAMVIGGALSGVGEMATELPVFMGVARLFKGGTKALINEGAKTLIGKYGKLGIEFAKNVALQSWQEAEMVPIEKGIKQAIGLPQDWSIKPLVKEMGVNAYGGMAMALVLGGLGGSVMGSTKIATKTMEAVDNVIQNKGDIRESLRKIAELQKIIPTEPEPITVGYTEKEKEYAEKYDIPIEKVKITKVPKVEEPETAEALRILQEAKIEPEITGKEKFLAKMEEMRAKKAEKPLLEEEVTVSLEEEGKVEALWAGEEVGGTEEIIDKDIKIKDVYTIGEITPTKKVKGKIREITGQTKQDKVSISELDILDLVLKGQEKAAKKAFSEGKKEGTFAQKEHFKDVVDRARERKAQKDYINKLIKDVNKLPTKNIAVDYKEMIEDIKSEFDLKKRTTKTLFKRQRLANYIEKQAKLDYEVDIPQEQIDIIRKIPLNEMTIEELETVHDNIMHLAHLGKTKDKLLKIFEKRSLQKQTDNLIDTLTKGKGIEFKDVIKTGREDRTFFQKVKEAGQTYHYNTVRAERLFEQADNYKDSGEFWTTFFKPINDATYEETDNYNKGLDNFRGFIKENNIDVGKFLADKQEINDRVTLTSTEKVEVFMATFDKDKMRHLIRGNNFTEKDVTDVMNSLTTEEKALGDYLIKHYEKQYKGINDIYKKLTGKNLPNIPGYSPIRLLSETIDTSRDIIESLLTKYNVRPSIRKGFTKERTKGAIQPLSLDALNNFMFNLSRVEHYKAFVLPIRDINKLLSNPKLIEAIKRKKGNPFYQNLKSWLLDVSDTNPGISFDQVDKIARLLRVRAADAMLGFNVVSAMKQPISVLNACAEIGISNVLNGIQQLTKSPIATTKIVYDKSPLVRNRKGQFDRVISELEQSKTIKQILKKSKTKSDIILGLIKFMDQQSVKAVWKGAYDQGLGKDMTDQEAIDYADKVIRKTQPMAGVKDLAKWFRGGTLSKMFTMFQNQINNNYNYYTHDILGKYRAGEIGVGKLMYRIAFSYVMPALLIGMVSRGRLPKDKEALKDLISFPVAGLFFVGAIVRNMIQGWDSFSIPPLSWVNDIIKAGTMKKISTKIRYGLSALAKLLGIPWNQPYRTIKGMIDYFGGATDDLKRLIWSEYALAEKKKEISKKTLKITIPKSESKGLIKYDWDKKKITNKSVKYDWD